MGRIRRWFIAGIAAILPMAFVSGLMGPYMRPIPVLGSSAMFFSLVAAFVFTPWFALRMRPASVASFHKAEAREQRVHKIIGRIYEPIIWPLIKHRTLGILFLVSIIGLTAAVCAMFYFKIVPVKMLPFDNKPEFNVVVNMPEGTALPVTANVVQQLAEKLRAETPEVTALQTYVGTASPFNFNGLVRQYYLREGSHLGDLQVNLIDKSLRDRNSHEIARSIRDDLQRIASPYMANVKLAEVPPGPPVMSPLVAEVYGLDYDGQIAAVAPHLACVQEGGQAEDPRDRRPLWRRLRSPARGGAASAPGWGGAIALLLAVKLARPGRWNGSPWRSLRCQPCRS